MLGLGLGLKATIFGLELEGHVLGLGLLPKALALYHWWIQTWDDRAAAPLTKSRGWSWLYEAYFSLNRFI